MKKRKLLVIDWEDHHSGGGSWTDIEQAKTYHKNNKPFVCTSSGFLIHEDKKRISIVQSQTNRDQVSDYITILKSCIKKKRVLYV